MAERVKNELIEKHHVDLVAGPDAYLTLPDLIAAVEAGEKAINVELSTTETYRDVIPSRICGNHISGFVSSCEDVTISAITVLCLIHADVNAAVTWKVS